MGASDLPAGAAQPACDETKSDQRTGINADEAVQIAIEVPKDDQSIVEASPESDPKGDQPENAACRPSTKALLTAGFAITAGWTDVVVFHCFGSFAALMTGNTVKLALSLFDEKLKDDSGYFISILCSYIFGAWLFQLCKHVCPGELCVCARSTGAESLNGCLQVVLGGLRRRCAWHFFLPPICFMTAPQTASGGCA